MCGKWVILPLLALIGITGILLSAGFYLYTVKKSWIFKEVCYSCIFFKPLLQKEKKNWDRNWLLAVEQWALPNSQNWKFLHVCIEQSLQKLLRVELSLNGKAFKKSVGNPKSTGGRWKYQQERTTTSAQPKFVFGEVFPSLEKEEMQSDREVTGETQCHCWVSWWFFLLKWRPLFFSLPLFILFRVSVPIIRCVWKAPGHCLSWIIRE